MNLNKIYESDIEAAALEWLAELGYTVLHGPDIAPDTPNAERSAYNQVILTRRLRDAIAHLNPEIPADAQEEALRKVLNPDSHTLVQNNRAFHLMLVDGIEVEYRQLDGTVRGARVRLVDFDALENNDWLAVNQFTVIEKSDRRPDIVLFINGLPLVVLELKNPTDEKATVLTMLERSIRAYRNRAIEASQVIEKLIEIAGEMRQVQERSDDLGLSDEELAFYDALEVNDSAVKVLGAETLKTIAVELVETVRRNLSIDWTIKESVRAKIRIMVKRTLRKHGYPPDKQRKASETVLEQAEVLCKDWAA